MKHLLPNFRLFVIIIVIAGFAACKKDKDSGVPIVSIEAGLKSNFGYKTGSYWIYRDSVSGQVDSAYVESYRIDSFYKGCVLYAGEPKYEMMYITIRISNGNVADTEKWNLHLEDSTCAIALSNNRDSTECTISATLFKYPFILGKASQHSGCVPTYDVGSVTDIIPIVSMNSQSYTNAAKSDHAKSSAPNSKFSYNDCFYVNQDAGIVKLVFDHPQSTVHRVLELQRYHLVR